MASRVSKINKNEEPYVSFQYQACWVNEQFDQDSWRYNRNIARKIVISLTPNELNTLPEDVKNQLLCCLKTGRISNADSKAISKLIQSNILETEYQHNLTIKGEEGFVKTTINHLSVLSSVSIGKMLLKSISKSGKQVTIIKTDRVSEAPPDSFKDAIPCGKKLKWQDLRGKSVTIMGTGKGSNTTIRYNPAFTFSGRNATWKNLPPEIALAHELIHADDSAYGRLDPEEIDGVRNYERQAVGLAPFEEKIFTENKFRSAWFPPIPLRTRY
ncbi:MAG TPA: M91 family zinc metallopeptidase [Blastocatellia bacterium]|nr:M91 family zinc metallopeptidase [Blastocatellia bacterium]